MLSCAGGTIRKGKGRVEASSLVSRRLECLVWERTEIWQGLIKDIGFLPNSSTAVLRETLVACLIKRRLIFKLHPPTLETRQTKFHTFFVEKTLGTMRLGEKNLPFRRITENICI